MKQIEQIRKLTGGRYLVVLEDGICFPLYKKELDTYDLQAEGMLSDGVYQIIFKEVLPKRAKLRAMHLLQQQFRTEQQLRTKLKAAEYPAEVVEEAIAYVKQYHYIDDVRFAKSYIEYRKDSKSMRQLEQELYQKGISRDVFREAADQIEAPDETAQIQEILRKKGYQQGVTEQKDRERILRFLLRKGYDMASIQKAMRVESLWE